MGYRMVKRDFGKVEYVVGLIVCLGLGIPFAIASIKHPTTGGILMASVLLLLAVCSVVWMVRDGHLRMPARRKKRRIPRSN